MQQCLFVNTSDSTLRKSAVIYILVNTTLCPLLIIFTYIQMCVYVIIEYLAISEAVYEGFNLRSDAVLSHGHGLACFHIQIFEFNSEVFYYVCR